jgi:exocyst complex component 6
MAPNANNTAPDDRPSDDLDDDVEDILNNDEENPKEALTSRARRRREEAVRRLVADVHRRPDPTAFSTINESHDWLVASTVATALERGLDKDLHAELVQEAKENAARIGQVCHDHSDAFLASVAKVVALGGPSAELAESLKDANDELQTKTAGAMLESAALLEHSKQSNSRGRTLSGMVLACRNVAVLLERAKKQAALGRPRAALDAVDEARTCLTAPVSSLMLGTKNTKETEEGTKKGMSLEETPFGSRAMIMLPKIENEVLMGARRGLNRWFLALRSGGDGAKAGRSVLRKCAHSTAVGPGQLGLGGHLPPTYLWRAKVADNLIARIDQNTKVARAVRLGYWFDRDGHKEAERLAAATLPGMGRRAEAFASAFGWYRCWDENSDLLVDVSAIADETVAPGGLSGSRHGRQGRTLGFRARESARGSSQAGSRRDMAVRGSIVGGGGDGDMVHSQWGALLTPSILFEDAPTR